MGVDNANDGVPGHASIDNANDGVRGHASIDNANDGVRGHASAFERRATQPQRASKLRLIVPILLAVTTTSAAVALVSAQSGCGDNDKPTVDGGDDRPFF